MSQTVCSPCHCIAALQVCLMRPPVSSILVSLTKHDFVSWGQEMVETGRQSMDQFTKDELLVLRAPTNSVKLKQHYDCSVIVPSWRSCLNPGIPVLENFRDALKGQTAGALDCSGRKTDDKGKTTITIFLCMFLFMKFLRPWVNFLLWFGFLSSCHQKNRYYLILAPCKPTKLLISPSVF